MLAVVAIKLGMCMQGMSTIHHKHNVCKQQQIASGDKFINKPNVPIYSYLTLAVVAMKVGMHVQGNVTNTPQT